MLARYWGSCQGVEEWGWSELAVVSGMRLWVTTPSPTGLAWCLLGLQDPEPGCWGRYPELAP